jgi:hypothetical protein
MIRFWIRFGPRVGVSTVLAVATAILSVAADAQPQAETSTAAASKGDPEAEALAGFDETIGLWFPPDAPRDVYLDRSDPKHDLIRDTQAAFKANSALRMSVCALLMDPKREVRASALPASVLQRRTQFHMLCVGGEAHEQEQAKSEAAWRNRQGDFAKWMNLAGARELTSDKRRARMLEIDDASELSVEPDGALKNAFEMFGLMPQADYAVYRLLKMNPSRGTRNEGKFVDFLSGVVDRESAEGMPEASLYRMATRHLLFYRGEIAEARALSRRLLEDPALERWQTDNRAVLALLNRLSGDAAALRGVAQTCEPPESARATFKERPAGAYCLDVAYALSVRSVDLFGEKAMPGFVDVLTEIVAAEPTNWERRVDSIRHVAIPDAVRGRILAEELLTVPATLVPLWARLEALVVVGSTSRKLKDYGRALAAYDLYLSNLRYRTGPLPPDRWSRLTELSELEEGKRSENWRFGWGNITWALGQKTETSIEAGDFSRARRALEEYLTVTCSIIDSVEKKKGHVSDLVDQEGVNASELEALRTLLDEDAKASALSARDAARWARVYLGTLGTACLKAGRVDEARRIVAYLITQPGGEGHALPGPLMELYYGPKSRGKPLKPAATPWETLPRANPRPSGQSRPADAP